MNNTMYRFTKDGHTYSSKGYNRFDAQLNIEFMFGVDLSGATFEEIYKLQVVKTGIVKQKGEKHER